jgi:hypothetical protein
MKEIKKCGVKVTWGGEEVKLDGGVEIDYDPKSDVEKYLEKLDLHEKMGDEIIMSIISSNDPRIVSEEYGIAIRNTFEYKYRMLGYKFRGLLDLIWNESFGKVVNYLLKNYIQK